MPAYGPCPARGDRKGALRAEGAADRAQLKCCNLKVWRYTVQLIR